MKKLKFILLLSVLLLFGCSAMATENPVASKEIKNTVEVTKKDTYGFASEAGIIATGLQ